MRSPRVGPETYRRLMDAHAYDAHAALAALPELARGAGVNAYAPCPPERAEAELRAGHALGATPIFLGSGLYPPLLAETDDAPPMLWALGDLTLLDRPAVALVGARNSSSLGRRMAQSLARGLAETGVTTVSGLARGIDAEVHTASLEQGTIAVVAGGVDVHYPPENADLQRRIGAQGLILSELQPGLRPQARHFPRRNRIIAGLTRALIVVEAAAKSGSLITARDAADYGREVLAVPGHPFDARSAGGNQLIRDGATLVRGPEDVRAAIAPFAQGPVRQPNRPSAATDAQTHPTSAGSRLDQGLPRAARPTAMPGEPAHAAPQPTSSAPADTGHLSGPIAPDSTDARHRVMDLLGPTPIPEDQLARDGAMAPGDLAALLTELELEGAVHRSAGGLVARAP